MRLQIKQFMAIAGQTSLESARQPVVLVLTLSATAFAALLPGLVLFTMGDFQRLVRDSILSLHLVSGLVLGCFVACSALNREIRSGTATTLLSKPIGRGLFFLAKFAGVSAVVSAFSLIMTVALLLAVRTAPEDFTQDWWGSGPLLGGLLLACVIAGIQNYFTKRPFVSRAFAWVTGLSIIALLVSCSVAAPGAASSSFGSAIPWFVLPAALLVAMAILLLIGIAAVLATRLDTVPVMTICSVIFLAGLMTDYWTGQWGARSPLLRTALSVLPNWQHFWAADALAREGIPWLYVRDVAIYLVFYLAAVLGAGIVAFRNMETR